MNEIQVYAVAQERRVSTHALLLGTFTSAAITLKYQDVVRPDTAAWAAIAVALFAVVFICIIPLEWRKLGREFFHANSQRWDVAGWLVMAALLLVGGVTASGPVALVVATAMLGGVLVALIGAFQASRDDKAGRKGFYFAAAICVCFMGAFAHDAMHVPSPVHATNAPQPESGLPSGPPTTTGPASPHSTPSGKAVVP
jgi:hypothetical protein